MVSTVLWMKTFHVNVFLPVASQFVVILEGVLAKISRYDEGTLFSSFLSFTVSFNSPSNLWDTHLNANFRLDLMSLLSYYSQSNSNKCVYFSSGFR